MPKSVKIQLPAPNGTPGAFLIDGEPIGGVTGFRLVGSVMDVPRLELDMSVHPFEFEGESYISVSPATREALIRFGWTPPVDLTKRDA